MAPLRGNREESRHICHVPVNWPSCVRRSHYVGNQANKVVLSSARVCEKHSSVFHLMPGKRDVSLIQAMVTSYKGSCRHFYAVYPVEVLLYGTS